MAQGCCSYGAHFVDDDDVQTVVRAFVRLEPRHMQFHAKAVKKGFLRPGDPDADGTVPTATRLVDDACIFLNRPGFEGGVGCALHIAALEAGERPLDWKPNVCWQVPIRLEHTTDDNGHVTQPTAGVEAPRLGRGRCRVPLVVHGGTGGVQRPRAPVYETSRDEIVELVGAADLRPDGRPVGTPRLDPAPAPDGARSTGGAAGLSELIRCCQSSVVCRRRRT